MVRAGFQLLDINGIEDHNETFEVSGVLTLQWKDERQAFDPAVEGLREKFYQGAYQFNELAPSWYPEIVLANVAGMFEVNGVVLRVAPDGTCTLVQGLNAVAKSQLNLRRYPFDRQRLEIRIEVLGMDENELVMEAMPITGFDAKKVRVPQWGLKDVGSTVEQTSASYLGEGKTVSTFVFGMEIERQAMFVLRLVVLPLFLVVVLSWSVFWMDRASLGDRMSVSFVGLLTVVAYQIVLGDILPRFSYVTLINAFLNFSFFVMCATIVVNLVVGELDKSGHSERSNRLDRTCRWMFPVIYGAMLAFAVAIAFLFF